MTLSDSLNRQGLAAAARQDWEEAIRCFAGAVELAPDARAALANLGLAQARSGRLDEAAASYRDALRLEPGHAATLAKLGRLLGRMGRGPEAIEALEQAASAAPNDADTLNALAAELAAGHCSPAGLARARTLLERAVELDPSFGEAWSNLGLLAAGGGRWSEAARAYERALALEAPTAALYYQSGVARSRIGERSQAIGCYRRAVELDPAFAQAWNNLAHELAAEGDREAALAAVHRALAERPDYLDARYNLGVTLQSLERFEEAHTAYQLVLAACGEHADTFNNLGGLCLSAGEPTLAVPHYEKALAVQPAHPEARWNLGLAQLASGDWEAGWRNYEARPCRREFAAPRWRPTDSLAGRTVLGWCEQGLGDSVQFLRYAGVLRSLGAARVLVECPRPLAGLFALAEGIDEVHVRGEGGAGEPAADFQVPLMSLPALTGTRLATVPAPGPVYRLSEARRMDWRQRLAGLGPGRKIGIVWGGNPANRAGQGRSMPLAALGRLAEVPGVHLVSLQHGPQCAELDAATCPVVRWEQAGLDDTAALVAELDLVVTVDTLMAHLAGTVARQTWVLLPFAADWRWMTGRADSPWYPGMRLFRQRRRGDWAAVAEDLAGALAAGAG